MWPNSCSSTERNSSTMNRNWSTAPWTPEMRQPPQAYQAIRRSRVRWIRTSVPPTRATVNDHRICTSSLVNVKLAPFHGAGGPAGAEAMSQGTVPVHQPQIADPSLWTTQHAERLYNMPGWGLGY